MPLKSSETADGKGIGRGEWSPASRRRAYVAPSGWRVNPSGVFKKLRNIGIKIDDQASEFLKEFPDIDDTKLEEKIHLAHVRAALLPFQTQWRGIGAILGLRRNELDAIAMDRKQIADRCLTGVIVQWFQNHSPVTWKKVVILAAARKGGNDRRQATAIAMDYKDGIPPVPEADGVDETMLSENDMAYLTEALHEVNPRWMEIGLYLGLRYYELELIAMKLGDNQVADMVDAWLRCNHNIYVFGKPSWKKLVEAIAAKAGGNNSKHAQSIAKQHRAPNAGHGQQHQLSEPKGKANNASDAPEKRIQFDFGEPKGKDDNAPDTSLPHYPMNQKPHGYALIINNKEFNLPLSGKPKLSTRDGTDADRDRLALVLQRLGYKVMPHNNRSAADIKQIINEYADSHCRKEHDSFVCCILSHGTEGQVYGSDSQLVKIRDLSRKLAGCESLTGKPKIFFIQACQGHEKPEQVPKPDHDWDEDPDKDVAFLPRDSDLFIGYATTPETVSLRYTTTGTWYIQELCNVLEENKRDLVTMITQVHHAVATKPEYCYKWTGEDGEKHEYRQQPQMISTLRHQVKF